MMIKKKNPEHGGNRLGMWGKNQIREMRQASLGMINFTRRWIKAFLDFLAYRQLITQRFADAMIRRLIHD